MIISVLNHASWLCLMIMASLLFLSVYSWTLIIRKVNEIDKQKKLMTEFDMQFWGVQEISRLYQQTRASCKGVLQQQFCAGYEASLKSNSPDVLIQAMTITHERHFALEEKSLQFLSTIASTAPYIGLLGTVLGVIHAFQGLGQMKGGVAIQLLAPGIAEALITTALGLFVAIPAMIAYNRFSAELDSFERRSLLFQQEFRFLMAQQS